MATTITGAGVTKEEVVIGVTGVVTAVTAVVTIELFQKTAFMFFHFENFRTTCIFFWNCVCCNVQNANIDFCHKRTSLKC